MNVTRRTVLQKVRRRTCYCTQSSCCTALSPPFAVCAVSALRMRCQVSASRLQNLLMSGTVARIRALFHKERLADASASRRSFLKRTLYSNIVLRQFVNTGFQVLFHSPPGVLFTFPSQYYALSVTKEYLALRGGPRLFHQGSTCLNVLWILPCLVGFRVRGFHPLWPVFPGPFC